MDPLSYFLAVGLAYGCLSVLIVISDRPRLYSPLGMLAGAYAAIAVGGLLQAFAGNLPFWAGGMLGNLLAWVGLVYQAWAILGLAGRTTTARMRLLVDGALLIATAILLVAPAAWRFAGGNVVYASLFGLSSWALLRWSGVPRGLRTVTSGLFLASAVLFVVRAVEFVTGGLEPTLDRSASQVAPWVTGILYPLIFTTLLAGAFSLLLLCRKSVETELQHATERLAQLAAFDELTGLPNRRSLFERARGEISRAERTGRPMCVAVLDLDRLKLINDGHGHAVGDEALQRVADACSACFRDHDTAARMGGDEFAVLLPDSDLAQGEAALARLLNTLRATPVVAGDFTIELSASVGVVQYQSGEALDDVFARADRAMYASKRAGGAMVVARPVETS